jgi:prenyl protein peptidase
MQIIGQMGLIPTNIIFAVDILKSLLLVVVLFGGPILDDLINLDSHASIFHSLIDGLTALRGIRDLLVAPLTEELVYTSSIITILLQSTTVSTWTLIVLPPVFFSIAHIHHAYELHVNKIAPLKVIIVSTLFQMLYTFIFGAFTDFIFLRQGNAWSCIIIHSFCNLMGVPNFSVDTRKFKYWNIVYYSLSLLGMYGFKFLLYPLTTSSNSLRSC